MSTYIYSSVGLIISPTQHGFMSQCSTVTNLECFAQYVAESLDKQRQVDVIYTDIQKAFDQVDHGVLLWKLVFLYRCWRFLKDIVEYLCVRSEPFQPSPGLPQGSNLGGPVLFLLFINDIANVICSDHLMFADDLKVFREISSTTDFISLQNDLFAVNG